MDYNKNINKSNNNIQIYQENSHKYLIIINSYNHSYIIFVHKLYLLKGKNRKYIKLMKYYKNRIK